MFMMSFRLRKAALLAGGLAVALALVVGVTWTIKSQDGSTAAISAQESPNEKIKTVNASGKTSEDRLKFIGSFGWEVEAEPTEIMEVIIPAKFDDVYEKYNSMQKMQGFDLSKYAGKRCKRYCYTVTNYPGTEEPVRISLLVYNNKIIGGDVCSMQEGGFMHGFKMA